MPEPRPAAGAGVTDRPTDTSAVLAEHLLVLAGRLVREVRQITPDAPALRLLSLLDEQGPSTVGHLAERDGVSQPTATQSVHRLVERGWLRRDPHPDDGRATLVSLTEEGLGTLREIRRRNATLIRDRLLATGSDLQHLEVAVDVLRTLTEGHRRDHHPS